MPKMRFTQPRATLEETLEFANRVRKAGGGNPLDALMPAVPEDPNVCLIAKNLNFNCNVGTISGSRCLTQWVMWCESRDLRDRIAEALELEPWSEEFDYDTRTEYGVLLPSEIGEVAETFDEIISWVVYDENFVPDPEDPTGEDGEWIGTVSLGSWLTDEEKQTFKEFWPYVDQSIRESFENATFINEKGEIVL